MNMPRNVYSGMGFPPFRGAVRQIILASVAIYVVILLLVAFAPAAGQVVLTLGVLDPAHIRQGWVWQFVTYAFMYVDPLQFALSLLGVYFLGGAVEDSIGTARFYGLFFGSLILSGLAGFALSVFPGGVIAHAAAMGSGAAANAILMVFYLLNRGAPIMLFPIPIQIPVKWIVLFTAAACVRDPAWVAEIFRTPDLQAALYFAFFILTDPPTSPVRHGSQIVCGVNERPIMRY